jgi:hypothetical protein
MFGLFQNRHTTVNSIPALPEKPQIEVAVHSSGNMVKKLLTKCNLWRTVAYPL